MPRITGTVFDEKIHQTDASMRPGRNAPDNAATSGRPPRHPSLQ